MSAATALGRIPPPPNPIGAVMALAHGSVTHPRMGRPANQSEIRNRSDVRLAIVALLFLSAFVVVGLRMSTLALSEPSEPRRHASHTPISAARADITDRHGRLLATNFETHALYAHPHQMVDPARAASALVRIFPDLDAQSLRASLAGPRRFVWIKRRISPEQMQAVHDIGEPGLLFGAREMRLYPNGALAAHVLGGAGFGKEGTSAAEVIGIAGVEKYFDDVLRDPASAGGQLALSLDLSVQAATEEVLADGMRFTQAQGASSVLMDAQTGEVIALASLPDFDPNRRPAPVPRADPSQSPLFNRAVQGVYELGSTFKIFAAAQALELGLAVPSSPIDTSGPIRWGQFTIRDTHWHKPELSLREVIVKSSNTGTARLAQQIGADRQKAFLRDLGFFAATPLELSEAASAAPLLPKNWSELSVMTISYGHGLSSSPLHLATAYATIANGGFQVTPTIVRQDDTPRLGPRLLSDETARLAQEMLRGVVQEGTAKMAQQRRAGYRVAGKTGTADKPRPGGGYYDDRVIATFAAMFPADAPRYVLIVSLDEPIETTGQEVRRTASRTAVPVAAQMIARVAPLLGLRPGIDTDAGNAVRFSYAN